jgi:hypothetical protein
VVVREARFGGSRLGTSNASACDVSEPPQPSPSARDGVPPSGEGHAAQVAMREGEEGYGAAHPTLPNAAPYVATT